MRWCALLAAFTACGPTTGARTCAQTPSTAPTTRAQPHGPIHHVVVVTLDGLLPDAYIHPDSHGLKIPTLRGLVGRGAASDGVESVFPTLTYPCHTTIATGVVPGKHGIVTNRSFDPLENDLEGWRWYVEDIQRDPIWRLVQRQGYDAALVHWPVSVGADVRWLVPEYWRAKNEQDDKLLRVVSTPGLLQKVAEKHPDFWSRYVPPAARDDALTDIAVHIITEGKPHLLMVHLIEVDAAQHRHGVWSAEAVAAMENDDKQVSRILEALDRAGIAKDTVLVVASDHGFMNAPKTVRPCVLLKDAGLVMTNGERIVDWKATLLSNSGHAYVYLRDPADKAMQERVRNLFTQRAKEPDSGLGRLYEAEEIRSRGGDPSAFMAVEPAPGTQFAGGCTGDYKASSAYVATHGFDPQRPELRASLVVAGPGIPHGTIANARLIDIAPTVATWLGISMPLVDGKPLTITPSR